MSIVTHIHHTENGDELIAYMARVSNPANQNNPDSEKLIRYLIKHKHWSPFEMVNLCVEVTTSRAIARQIIRHRSFSFQEFSQRYADATDLGYPQINLRRQDLKNRQNSIEDLPSSVKEEFSARCYDAIDNLLELYQDMLNAGVAKECARAILPESMPTTLYMNGTLRSWIHYIDLRAANGTQKEHQDVALGAKEVFRQHFPATAGAVWGEEA